MERYCGADLARELARAFVIDVRNDLQSIYAGLPAHSYHQDDQVQTIQAWIHEHYKQSTSLGQLAEMVHLSPRQLQRRFTTTLGEPPLQYVIPACLPAITVSVLPVPAPSLTDKKADEREEP